MECEPRGHLAIKTGEPTQETNTEEVREKISTESKSPDKVWEF